jgi:hypothetical protein
MFDHGLFEDITLDRQMISFSTFNQTENALGIGIDEL